ncbi:Nif3-like dinuclear metal center hexameric protein [Mycoplasmopsis verecunda]|uniref:GTP cyclohydrolase 1 type 2 homolog n=1 Tax=Mycoplasmopsis verecunda TaxID=171291 RepID=A0A1T4KJK8_9BACT|nr:Nif3-like dinuclear metal center hexameric protein [Mycoplasmopsis verecunda]WPB54254.1 Nif3-like dinuclear metal center hexameric protein [Mycoplasmopsis verecunda]SJZ42622.1 dinuclear metal center protein, YbgI/SA1388 family [Mycoplasmopsis verecunda]
MKQKSLKIKDFIAVVNSMYPNENKEIWDPSGYSVKTVQAKKFKGAVLAIDLTKEVLQEAIDNDCNVILTHHPFKFEARWIDEDNKAPYKREILNLLRKHQITAYSMHTNYDCDPYGTSYQIVKALGLENTMDWNASQIFSAVFQPNKSLNELKELFIDKLKFNSFRTNINPQDYDKKVNKVAVLSGSGYIGQIVDLSKNVDLIISSDFRWSDWIVFDQNNINILEVPHLDEQVFAYHMYLMLVQMFPEYRFIVKELDEPYHNL